MLNKCAIEIVSLSIIAAFDGNSKNLKKIPTQICNPIKDTAKVQ
jgi:hypothetical protein